MLLDTMDTPGVYFRFNPYMSEEFTLDENRPEKWNMMQHETSMYMRRNDYKVNMVAKQLLKPKTRLKNLKNLIVNHKLNCSLKRFF